MSSATSHPPPPPPHIALLLSAGMGHLTPTLRLAAMLASNNCHVTLTTARPLVSIAESTHISAFLEAYPTIKNLDFQIIPYTPPAGATVDPFFVQYEAIRQSAHLLTPLLSSTSPPLSAIVSDLASSTGGCQAASDLGIPHYILSTTSARFISVMLHIPYLITHGTSSIPLKKPCVQIPGMSSFDISTIPPPFFIPNHIFTNNVVSASSALSKAKGILSNTFHAFEHEAIEALNGGKVKSDLPPFLPIGPLEPHKLELGDPLPISWLDQQPLRSVVYVSFGSRTALSRDQIIELRDGLELSGLKFLWVLKSKIVDTEDTEELEEVVGDSFIQRMEGKGMVVKGWVNQEKILSHPAIGGFVSHCGWNSVMEAAARGIPMLAWPQLGDQKVNAAIVEAIGLGIRVESWGWMGEKLVRGGEIAEKVRMMITDEILRENARSVGEQANDAIKVGGTSNKVLREMILNL